MFLRCRWNAFELFLKSCQADPLVALKATVTARYLVHRDNLQVFRCALVAVSGATDVTQYPISEILP